MSNAFTTYMQETYSHNQLADMANHGANTGHNGLIWTNDLVALFDKYRDDMFSIMSDYSDSVGEDGFPPSVAKNSEDFDSFAGAVVYFCAEWVGYTLTQGEYIEDSEKE